MSRSSTTTTTENPSAKRAFHQQPWFVVQRVFMGHVSLYLAWYMIGGTACILRSDDKDSVLLTMTCLFDRIFIMMRCVTTLCWNFKEPWSGFHADRMWFWEFVTTCGLLASMCLSLSAKKDFMGVPNYFRTVVFCSEDILSHNFSLLRAVYVVDWLTLMLMIVFETYMISEFRHQVGMRIERVRRQLSEMQNKSARTGSVQQLRSAERCWRTQPCSAIRALNVYIEVKKRFSLHLSLWFFSNGFGLCFWSWRMMHSMFRDGFFVAIHSEHNMYSLCIAFHCLIAFIAFAKTCIDFSNVLQASVMASVYLERSNEDGDPARSCAHVARVHILRRNLSLSATDAIYITKQSIVSFLSVAISVAVLFEQITTAPNNRL